MKRKIAILSALPLCLLPFAALAQGPSVNVGIDLTSNYMNDGATNSNNQAAIQPNIELTSGIFYGGLWFSNIVMGPDTRETDVYLGITGNLGKSSNGLTYDVNYTQVYYNSTGNQGGTLESTLGYSPTDNKSVSISLENNTGGVPAGVELDATYPIADGLSMAGEIGKGAIAGPDVFWSLTLTKNLSKTVSVSASYHDTNTTTPLYVATVSWAKDLNELFDK